MTGADWFFWTTSVCLATSIGYAWGGIMKSAKHAEQAEPFDSRYVRPDSNLLRSGGYQPRKGKKPKAPKTGSGVRKAQTVMISPTESRRVKS